MANIVEMVTAKGQSTRLVSFEEMLVPEKMAEKAIANVKCIKDMKFKDGDILVCSYPKSGTHWTTGLIRELIKVGSDESNIGKLGLLEITQLEGVDAMPSPRLIPTHLRTNRIKHGLENKACKVVLVVRNPKDIMVSFYYHLQTSVAFGNQQTWDEYFASTIEGKTPYGSYFDYLMNWESFIKDVQTGNRRCNIEVFYYEDLKQYPLENVRRLSKHLGVDKSDDELKLVIEACTLGNLQARDNKDKSKIPPPLKNKDGNTLIYRKGDVGDWKNHFTVSQNEVFDKIIEDRLNGSMFKFKYTL